MPPLSLFLTTLLCGVLLVLLGIILLWRGPAVVLGLQQGLRSKPATVICFGLGTVWFLWHISRLGEADFGQYKGLLLAGFASVGVLALFFTPDFLAVRGAAILVLLTSWVGLEAAYMQWDYPGRLWLVGFIYCCVIIALYLGTVPYRLRDFLQWLAMARGRSQTLGGLLAIYGLLLCGVGLAY